MQAQFKLTKAKARVLIKASTIGYVMISGGFSGIEDVNCIYSPTFDRRSHIETLVHFGLLEGGEGANQFRLTEAGEEVLGKVPARQQWLYDEDKYAQLCEQAEFRRNNPSAS